MTIFTLEDKQLQIRTKILTNALYLEALTSSFIGLLLDIDIQNSKSLGTKSSALSFNNKINLLIDMNSLKKEDGSKFEKFMSIRNQFMHSLLSDSYTKCVENIDGLGNWLRKTYQQDNNLDLESQYEKSVDNLSKDLLVITTKLIELVEKKAKQQVKSEFDEKFNKLLLYNLKESCEQLDKYLESIIANKAINIKELRGKGKELYQSVFEKSIKPLEDDT